MKRTIAPRGASHVGFGGVEAPESWPRPRSAPRAGAARGVRRVARRRRSDDRAPAREARAAHGRRSPLAAAAALRGAGADEAHLRSLRRRGGRDRGRRALGDEPPARAPEDPHRPRSQTTRARSRRPGSTSPGSRRSSCPARRSASAAARIGTASPCRRTTSTARRRPRDFAPVYPAGEDVTQKKLRDLHAQALEHVRDVGEDLPPSLLAAERLPLRADALAAIHRPRSLPEAEVGRRPARLRGAARAPARAAAHGGRAARAASAQPLGAPGELLERYRESLPVHAHGRPGAGDRPRSTPISSARSRCSASCRETSARARPSSRCTRCCARSSATGRAR